MWHQASPEGAYSQSRSVLGTRLDDKFGYKTTCFCGSNSEILPRALLLQPCSCARTLRRYNTVDCTSASSEWQVDLPETWQLLWCTVSLTLQHAQFLMRFNTLINNSKICGTLCAPSPCHTHGATPSFALPMSNSIRQLCAVVSAPEVLSVHNHE